MCRVAPEEILGVEKEWPEERVREAYRRLTKAVHPDTGGSNGLFVVLTDAYEAITGLRGPGPSGGKGGRQQDEDSGKGSGPSRPSGASGTRKMKTVTVEAHGPSGVILTKSELFQLMRRSPGSVIYVEYIAVGRAPFTCDGESVPEGYRLVVKGGSLHDWYAFVEFDGAKVNVK